MLVNCVPEGCKNLISSKCVFYESTSLLTTGIKTNDSLEVALYKIDLYLTNLPVPETDNFYINNVQLVGNDLIFTGIGSAFSGTISLSSLSSTPAGNNTEVQFNDGGSFGSSSNVVISGDMLLHNVSIAELQVATGKTVPTLEYVNSLVQTEYAFSSIDAGAGFSTTSRAFKKVSSLYSYVDSDFFTVIDNDGAVCIEFTNTDFSLGGSIEIHEIRMVGQDSYLTKYFIALSNNTSSSVEVHTIGNYARQVGVYVQGSTLRVYIGELTDTVDISTNNGSIFVENVHATSGGQALSDVSFSISYETSAFVGTALNILQGISVEDDAFTKAIIQVYQSTAIASVDADKIGIRYDGLYVTQIMLGSSLRNKAIAVANGGSATNAFITLYNPANNYYMSSKFRLLTDDAEIILQIEPNLIFNANLNYVGQEVIFWYGTADDKPQTYPSVISKYNWSDTAPTLNIGDRFLMMNDSGSIDASWAADIYFSPEDYEIYEVQYYESVISTNGIALTKVSNSLYGQRVYVENEEAFYKLDTNGVWVLDIQSKGVSIENTSVTGTYNIDLTKDNFELTLTGNTTLAVINTPNVGESIVVTLYIQSDSTETLTIPGTWNLYGDDYLNDGSRNQLALSVSNNTVSGLTYDLSISNVK